MKTEYTCEACTAVTTKLHAGNPHIYRRVSARILGDDLRRKVDLLYDNSLTELQNHERAALEFIDKYFPQCKLRRMAYIQESGYVFGIYYSKEEAVSVEEASGVPVPLKADRTVFCYEGDEFELN